MRMQYSVHSPTQFIQTYADQLLPDWSQPILSILVVLQQCSSLMLSRTLATETQKRQGREQFLQFGHQVALELEFLGHLADLFDPATGWPLRSPPGRLHLDDVAVVRAALQYPTMAQGDCTLVIHPEWESAVYPSVLVSSAPLSLLETVAAQVSDRYLLDLHH
ncbi:methylmalonic aciduria and homocystinuria type D protein [Trichocoleus sp. FACHB-46]|nr:methylmalonic aciduria and homocystinuria type D protein [Trichocoleus sp. FACHB-46]